MPPIDQDTSRKVVIVGAGCFGISTAYHLLLRGHQDVKVLDRSEELPAPDAASSDFSKIARSCYEDPFYAHLAKEAIALWKDSNEWKGPYRENGILVFSSQSADANTMHETDADIGARVTRFEPLLPPTINSKSTSGTVQLSGSTTVHQGASRQDISHKENGTFTAHSIFLRCGANVKLGPMLNRAFGYFNEDAGYVLADAQEGAVSRGMKLVRDLGGVIISGKKAVELVKGKSNDRPTKQPSRDLPTTKITGVRCADGTEYAADIVILAAGAWTASAFPELGFGNMFVANGQSVAAIQLTAEELKHYKKMPVVVDFWRSAFYVLPPSRDGILKIARHSPGHINPESSTTSMTKANSSIAGRAQQYRPPTPDTDDKSKSELWISTPRTILSHGKDGMRIPIREAQELRKCLKGVFPALGDRDFAYTRMCWYTDSPDSDWVIDEHPEVSGLFLATSGSGHAFKFFPVLGRLIVDRIEGKMSSDLIAKFAIKREQRERIQDRHRSGVPKILADEKLYGAGEPLPDTSLPKSRL